jgi:hypothetical protein
MLDDKVLDDSDKGDSAKRILRSDEETQYVKQTETNKMKFN